MVQLAQQHQMVLARFLRDITALVAEHLQHQHPMAMVVSELVIHAVRSMQDIGALRVQQNQPDPAKFQQAITATVVELLQLVHVSVVKHVAHVQQIHVVQHLPQVLMQLPTVMYLVAQKQSTMVQQLWSNQPSTTAAAAKTILHVHIM